MSLYGTARQKMLTFPSFSLLLSLFLYLPPPTPPSPPPTVFHYQVKVHFFSKNEMSFSEQPLRVSLYGTNAEKEDIPLTMYVLAPESHPRTTPGYHPIHTPLHQTDPA